MESIEILKTISIHQIQGIMFHRDMILYYDFLGLKCFKRMHEYQCFKEMSENNSINRYAINHLNKIIILERIEPIFNIPNTWSTVNRLDVSNTNRQSYLKKGFDEWHEWETKTKKLYAKVYKDLCEIEDYATAKKVMCLLKDVDMELKKLERWIIKLDEIDYDLKTIAIFEDDVHDKYISKTKKIGAEIF